MIAIEMNLAKKWTSLPIFHVFFLILLYHWGGGGVILMTSVQVLIGIPGPTSSDSLKKFPPGA